MYSHNNPSLAVLGFRVSYAASSYSKQLQAKENVTCVATESRVVSQSQHERICEVIDRYKEQLTERTQLHMGWDIIHLPLFTL